MTGPGTSDEPQPDVGRQRTELAETVEELAHRVDVPARARAVIHEKADEAAEVARRRAPVLAVAAGAVAALVVFRIVRRRHRRS